MAKFKSPVVVGDEYEKYKEVCSDLADALISFEERQTVTASKNLRREMKKLRNLTNPVSKELIAWDRYKKENDSVILNL